MSEILVQERQIRAPANVVYALLTDARWFVEWMAVEADLDPQIDGVIRWRHANGDVCQGRFVELIPYRRVVFTYGWERFDIGIPPGSTVVEIDLSESDGVTTLRLTHRGLSPPAAEAHALGWGHYLGRLGVRAEGGDPVPDPWADQRAPSFT